ncbi:hypothetical protein HSE3_gp062 [Bacillus phage vB_BceM-HSE3]|nr:hypothetical protein HSE3_gp062 [Bacillus phage vB_BceM-HSE3]
MAEQVLKELVSPTSGLSIVESVSHKAENVLRTLKGPFADFKNPTRNKRGYSRKLWENVLASPNVLEMLSTKTFFGEADHPNPKEERLEVSFSKVSHNITDLYINDQTGLVEGSLDILDTPMGRILNTLVGYGSKIGISSRGSGRVLPGPKGARVDESTYRFVTFDAVVLPANESARLTESVDQVNSLVDELQVQVDDFISKGDPQELEAVHNILESLELAQLQPLCESVQEALGSTSTEEPEPTNDGDEPETEESADSNTITTEGEVTEDGKADDESVVVEGNEEQPADNTSQEEEEEVPAEPEISEELKELRAIKSIVLAQNSLAEELTSGQEKRIAELTDQLSQVNEELSLKESIIASQDKKLLKFSDSNKNLIEHNKQLMNDMDDLKSQLSESQESLTKVQEALDQVNSDFETLSEASTVYLQETADHEQVVADLKEEVSQLTEDKQTLQESTLALEEKLSKSDAKSKKFFEFIKPYVDLKCAKVGIDSELIMPYITESTSLTKIDNLITSKAEKSSKVNNIPVRLEESAPQPVSIKEVNSNSPRNNRVASIIKGL